MGQIKLPGDWVGSTIGGGVEKASPTKHPSEEGGGGGQMKAKRFPPSAIFQTKDSMVCK